MLQNITKVLCYIVFAVFFLFFFLSALFGVDTLNTNDKIKGECNESFFRVIFIGD